MATECRRPVRTLAAPLRAAELLLELIRHNERTRKFGNMIDTRPKYVLAVDDDHICRKIYQLLASRLNFKLDVAINCHEALSAVQSNSYDLILMDIGLPDCDGLTCANLIRQRENQSRQRTPIIAITAHAMTGDREAFLANGLDDYLSKPFRIEDFEEKIKTWLGRGNLSFLANHERANVAEVSKQHF